MRMWRDTSEEQKELGFAIALTLTPFKRNKFKPQHSYGFIPYHNATTRRMKAVKAIASVLGLSVYTGSNSVRLYKDNDCLQEFATPQELAAWLLVEYSKRKDNDA